MRQLIIARKDLNMSAGKLSSQVSHASMAFLTAPLRDTKGDKNRIKRIENGEYVFELKMDAETYDDWVCGIFTKTVCAARNRNHLLKAKKMAEEMGMEEEKDFFLIKDNCLTELEPEEMDENGVGRTLTCIGFRPLPDDVAHEISRKFSCIDEEEKMEIKKIDVTKCFIDDSDGFWDNFWENRDGLGASPHYADPDSASATLRNYHQALWSRKLPNGQMMKLEKGKKSDYLIWNGMRFASDSMTTSHRYIKCKTVIQQVEKQTDNYRQFVEESLCSTYTIGGMIIFPKLRGSMNQDRGTNPMIADRWDLTLECIKRYYEQPENDNYAFNPLWKTIKRSESFFKLFVDFNGYIEFFFLQDFIDKDGNVIRFMPDYFDTNGNFTKKYPVPQTAKEYLKNIEIQKEIVKKRNKRIYEFVNQ